jgi:hypothetical protein
MSDHCAAISALTLEPWTCERCGCQEDRACRIEIMVARPNGERTLLFEDECGQSAQGLCTACDARLLPELESLLDVWRQLGVIARTYRGDPGNEPLPRASKPPLKQ